MITALIDDVEHEFESLDDLARRLAYYKAELIEANVRCPDLSREEIAEVVAKATDYVRYYQVSE